METRQNPVLSKSIILVILLSLGYWTFLFFSSEMHIVFDSISYQNSGKRIYTQGWIEHFRTGPNREPLYLYMIAISMQLADFLSVQYQTIQKILQILVMLISQIMLWRILARLKIRPGIITFVLLYWGLSPAINNSALSLFSEIATYPFVLAIIFISILGYQSIKKNKLRRSLVYGLILGLLFIFVTFVKALFGYI
ncbi:MAG: hypothetical protein KC618_04005, partial [Candidatus Omnitrophica bacterium]|nr:hypothetical protein [Candidatus Omnitrophota bacterium]